MTGPLPRGDDPRPLPEVNTGLPHDGPPVDVPDALEQAARWLDAFDRFYRTLLTDHGVDPDTVGIVEDDEVQQFLRDLARWFTDRPVLALVAWNDLQTGHRPGRPR